MEIRVIGVPMDLGADRRGVDMGPSAIRYAGLTDELETVGHDCIEAGDIAVPRPENLDDESSRAKYLTETEAVCRDLRSQVTEALDSGRFPLVLGGDHSIAIGTAGGAATRGTTGLVWFDAHGDFNTPETTPSGNVHGMSVAALLGEGEFADSEWAHAPNIDPENVAMVGIRSLDTKEREALRDSDVTVFTMSDIDQRGLPTVADEALSIAGDDTDGMHISLDMDFLAPAEAPGVGTPVRGGVTYREAHAAMESVGDRLDEIHSMEVVEVNPILDSHNKTAELAVELIASALGKRIL